MTALTPPWEDQESFFTYDYEPKMDVSGAPSRASTLSLSHLPFVLFSARTKARQPTKLLLPSDVDVAFPFSPVSPPPPIPMLRQQTLPLPLHTPPLSVATAPNSEPQIPAPCSSVSAVLTRPRLPKLPQPPPMATPAVPVQVVAMGLPLPQTAPVPSSSGPRVRPLPQRPPTAKSIEDESPCPQPGDKIGHPNSAQVNGYHSELDSNALRRNRHIRRAQKVPLNGPRPLPPLPGTNPSTYAILTGPNGSTLKRASSPTQPAPPRIFTALQRSMSDPTSPPLSRKPNLSLVIPKLQVDDRGRHLPQQEPRPTPPSSSDGESSSSRSTKSQAHSLDHFPTIDYASVATPSASRRPPPSAHPDGGRDRDGNLLDWHLLEEALGIDGDADVRLTESPVMVSFLPSPGAPPVPAIPDRFLAARGYCRTVSQTAC